MKADRQSPPSTKSLRYLFVFALAFLLGFNVRSWLPLNQLAVGCSTADGAQMIGAKQGTNNTFHVSNSNKEDFTIDAMETESRNVTRSSNNETEYEYTLQCRNGTCTPTPEKPKQLPLPAYSTFTKSNAGKKIAINVYKKNDIVSGSIVRGQWEGRIVNQISNVFTSYSTKHSIPLSQLTFIDIGANVGWFTLSIAALGVQVLAFEPMQQNIDLLQSSLDLPLNKNNGITGRVKLFPHGLGTKDEMCIVYSGNTNVGDGHVKCVEREEELGMESDYSVRGRVIVHRLDDVLKDLIRDEDKHIVAIKMDVEGYEPHVLSGGTEIFLNSGVRAIFTEFNAPMIRGKGGDPVKYINTMAEAGYLVLASTTTNIHMTKEQMAQKADAGKLKNDLRLHSEK